MESLNQEELNSIVEQLIEILVNEDDSNFSQNFSLEKKTYIEKRKILNSLLISRKTKPIPFNLLKLQNQLLEYENSKKEILNASKLIYQNHMCIYLGDITCIKADAIVCSCYDNFSTNYNTGDRCAYLDILLSGGIQIKQELNFETFMQSPSDQNCKTKLIKGYNLPASFIICTVAPTIISGRVSYKDKENLINCYKACLELALEKGFKTIAFTCLGTGKKNYPKALASEIAVSTVFNWLKANNFPLNVIFCVHNEENKINYEISFKDYDVV